MSSAEPWADTGTSTGRLMLAVLGGLADVERDLIRTRTAEGRNRAKARGKHMGRPPPSPWSSRKRPPDATHRARRARRGTWGLVAAAHVRILHHHGSPMHLCRGGAERMLRNRFCDDPE